MVSTALVALRPGAIDPTGSRWRRGRTDPCARERSLPFDHIPETRTPQRSSPQRSSPGVRAHGVDSRGPTPSHRSRRDLERTICRPVPHVSDATLVPAGWVPPRSCGRSRGRHRSTSDPGAPLPLRAARTSRPARTGLADPGLRSAVLQRVSPPSDQPADGSRRPPTPTCRRRSSWCPTSGGGRGKESPMPACISHPRHRIYGGRATSPVAGCAAGRHLVGTPGPCSPRRQRHRTWRVGALVLDEADESSAWATAASEASCGCSPSSPHHAFSPRCRPDHRPARAFMNRPKQIRARKRPGPSTKHRQSSTGRTRGQGRAAQPRLQRRTAASQISPPPRTGRGGRRTADRASRPPRVRDLGQGAGSRHARHSDRQGRSAGGHRRRSPRHRVPTSPT